jgi:smad nuclear-interacting protein 1
MKQDPKYIMDHHPLIKKLQADSLTNYQVPDPSNEAPLKPTPLPGHPAPSDGPAEGIKCKPNYFTTGLLQLRDVPSAVEGGLQGVTFNAQGQLIHVPVAGRPSAASAQGQPGALYKEPSDAAVPTAHWRLFIFRARAPQPESVDLLRRSCFRLGRNPELSQVVLRDPSCSGAHAVVQFRTQPGTDAAGRAVPVVKPYVMDLGSTNGSFLKDGSEGPGRRLDKLRYYEVLDNDVLRFGSGKDEYVFVKVK